MFKRLKIRNKMLTLIIVTGFIPLLALSTLTYSIAYQINYDQVLKHNEIILKLKQNTIHRFLNNIESDSQAIASSEFIHSYFDKNERTSSISKETEGLLKNYLATYSQDHDFIDVFIKDTDLRPIFTLYESPSTNNLECQCEAALKSQKPLWSKIQFAPKYDDFVFSLSTPIIDHTGHTQGVITFVLPQSILLNIVHKDVKQIGLSGDSYLIDADQNLLTQTLLGQLQDEDALFKPVETKGTKLLKEAMENDNYAFTATDLYVDYRGLDVLGAIGIVMIGDIPTGLLIEIDYDEAFAKINTLRNLLSALTAGVLITSALFFGKFSKSITDPISKLEKGILKIINGDMRQELSVDSKDEIGAISQAFNKMVNELSSTLVSKEKLRTIFDTMSDPIIVTQSNGLVTYMNQVAVESFCAEENCLADFTIQDLLTLSSTHDNWDKIYSRFTLETGQTHSEITINHEQEGERLYRVEHSTLNGSSNPVKEAISIFRDITALKEIEESLVSTAKSAEQASHAKGYFLANMSHEIRTPLNTIIGYSEYLLDKEVDDSKIESLESIIYSGRLLQEIVDDVLDYSKIESGKIEIVNRVFSLEQMVIRLKKMFDLNAHSKDIDIHISFTKTLPNWVYGDEYKIQQILVNLVSNAIKFTDVGFVEIGLNYSDGHVHFIIKDTGTGMTKEEAQRVFAPFEQADITTSRTYGGTGLGLTISKALIDHLGGQIELESETLIGTTFKIMIPLVALPRISNYKMRGRDRVSHWLEDNAGLEDLLFEVLSKLPHYLENVENAINRRDVQNVYLTGHAMKSVTLNYSMNTLSNILEYILIESKKEAPRFKYLEGLLAMLNDIVNELPNRKTFSHESKTIEPASDHPFKILVADDKEMNRKLIARLLEDRPVSIDFTENGQETLEKLHLNAYSALLLDIQMPLVSGIEVLKHLRDHAHNLKGNPPYTIVMSAIATSDDIEKIKALDCDDYLTKPIQAKALQNKIDSLIQSQAFMK